MTGWKAPAGGLRWQRLPAFYLNKIKRKLSPQTLPQPTPAEARLIEHLRQKIEALPQIDPNEVATPAERLWAEFRGALRSALLTEDPRTFLEFRVIRETMFVDAPAYVGTEYEFLRSLPNWRERWQSALRESDRILVPPCPYHPGGSGSSIHYVFQAALIEKHIGVPISTLGSILEFGGGFGGMCRILRTLDFRGSYRIFDVPEFSALQEFYLQMNGIEAHSGESQHSPGVVCFSDLAQFEELNRNSPSDLFLAAWSLSETPLELRRTVLAHLTARHIYIAFQREFETIDNFEFFSEWSSKKTTHEWRMLPATHLPGENFYLMGSAREWS
jgi:hypothetical protein